MLGFYQPISSWTHLLAGLVTLCTGYILIRRGWGNSLRVASLLVFMAGIVFVFLMSGTYHALPPGLGREVFRRLDYAAIFTMIAGTATPIHIILFRGFWRWGMLSLLWVVAITGLLLTVILLDRIPPWLILTVFISMGWSVLASMIHATRLYGFRNVALAFYGGIAYTLGAMMDFLEVGELIPGLVGHHEIFHVFVILGAAMHWKLIYHWANQPLHDRLVFMVRETASHHYLAKAIGESFRIRATSKEELRKQVKELLLRRVHPRLVPQKIRFRFYHDVVINKPQLY
jgi:channel protein (hemolysin III family)